MMNIWKTMTVALAAVFLAACAQGGSGDGGGPGGGGGGGLGPGDGPADLNNCAVPASTLCVLGGPDHGNGLVEALLDPQGPLGPIAGTLDTDDLTTAIECLLNNDSGDLPGILTGLLAEGQLQEGLEFLLLGNLDGTGECGGEGEGGLANILEQLLLGSEEGQGLVGLFGEEGLAGLISALTIDPNDPADCQAPAGTVCLVSNDPNRWGLVDLLLNEGGVLNSISDELTQEELVDILGDMLDSDGSLANLVEGLFMEGQLQAGLEALLLGDPDDPEGQPGLVTVLEGILGTLPDIIGDTLCFIGLLVGQCPE